MSWTADLISMAAGLEGQELEYAWASFPTTGDFARNLCENNHLTPAMREGLMTSSDAKVRAAFARRSDLSEAESTTLSQDRITSVVAAWLETHDCDIATLESMVALGRAGVLDSIIRVAGKLPVAQSTDTLTAVLMRVLSTTSTPASDSMSQLSNAVHAAGSDRLEYVASRLYGLKAANPLNVPGLTRSICWRHGRASQRSAGLAALFVALASTVSGLHQREALDQADRELSEVAGNGGSALHPTAISWLSRELDEEGRRRWTHLASAVYTSTSSGQRTLAEIVDDPALKSQVKAQALADAARRGIDVTAMTTGGSHDRSQMSLATIALLEGEQATSVLEAYLSSVQVKEAWHVTALLELCDTHPQGADLFERVAGSLPERAEGSWWSLNVPAGLIADVPVSLQLRHGSRRNEAPDMHHWLLGQCYQLKEQGYRPLEVNTMLETLLDGFHGTPRELVGVLRDSLEAQGA